jgi:DNA-binding NtrC family response regulator
MDRVDVLVVEDDLELAAALEAWMETRELTTVVARTCEDAVAKLRESRFAVVLLDLTLAGFSSGFYFVEHVKRMAVEDRPPVVMTTGASASTLSAVDRTVVSSVFFKPVDLGPLSSYVAGLVRKEN